MCEPEGWIKIHRKILKWEWYDDAIVFKLFMHCLFKANFEEKQWHGTAIPKGSFVTSIANLAGETFLTIKQVRNALNKLIKTKEITTKGTNKYTMLTINNYDTYQIKGEAKGRTKGEQRANGGQTEGKQRATTKEYKELEELQELENNIMSDNSDVVSIHSEIIDYLNSKAKSDYKHTTPKTKQLINARLNEKFTLENFKTVIDKKTKEWINDPKFCTYLRPETLFGTKFESYLNQKEGNYATTKPATNGRNDRLTIQQLEASYERSKGTIYADATKHSGNYRTGNAREQPE